MQYYDPNDRRPRRWALLVTALYALTLALSFAFVSFDFTRTDPPAAELVIELYEPPQAPPPPSPVQPAVEPHVHRTAAPVEQTAQTQGEETETRTPNPRALFAMNKSGADEPENAGNPQAREGEEQNAGNGPGLSPDGLACLDKGLQGRGLVAALPIPSSSGSKIGKVVISVTVDASGKVTSAAYKPKGSTTNDPDLVSAAMDAARRARFTESRAMVQGGDITYNFIWDTAQ